MTILRLNAEAFLSGTETRQAVEAAFADRRLSRARLTVFEGGIDAALARFGETVTPDLLLVESAAAAQQDLTAALEKLSEVCQPETRVIVIGPWNDVPFYRALKRQGVSEYLPVPVTPSAISEAVLALYADPSASRLGRLISFIGAAGGCGTSQLAHNFAFRLAKRLDASTALIDLDVAFGTSSLEFNLESPQDVSALLAEPGRIDDTLLDRFMAKYVENLFVLTGPPTFMPPLDVPLDAVEMLVNAARRNTSFVVLDVPKCWSPATQAVLQMSDEVVVVTPPTLVGLRNAKHLVEALNPTRINEAPARLVLNRVGQHAKTELAVKDFVAGVGQEPSAVIGYDPAVFALALNSGQMIGEGKAAQKVIDIVDRLAMSLSGRPVQKKTRKGLAGIFRLSGSRKPALAG
jgi:pilus assembly protein CpaE